VLSGTEEIPSSAGPIFKHAKDSNGLLDTIEVKYFTKVNPLGFLDGFQEVPFFLTNFSTADQINSYITNSVHRTVDKLLVVNTSAIESNTFGDLALAKTLGELQEALKTTLYGGKCLNNLSNLF
jgi:hypothetical protein